MRTLLALALVLTTSAGCTEARPAATMRVTSPDFADGAAHSDMHVYDRGGCSGGNLSPALRWSAPPEGTKSLAVTMHDPDAPRPGGWWHWLAWDLPAQTTTLGRGELPAGVQGRNDFGGRRYDGPCPPPGAAHRYVFTVWALDTPQLGAAADARPAEIERLLERHAVARGAVTGRYGR